MQRESLADRRRIRARVCGVAAALALGSCATAPPPATEPDVVDLVEPASREEPRAGVVSRYLELAAVVAEASPERAAAIESYFERTLSDGEPGPGARMQLAVVLASVSTATVPQLERARALLSEVHDDPVASTEIVRLAALLQRTTGQRLALMGRVREGDAELARARADLARYERSRDETESEIEELREALASTRTKLREMVRIEQAVETSGAPESRP